jgi:hypothetical protein
MASIKEKKRSPYWYIQYRDLDTGTWKTESTKLRVGYPPDDRKAQRLRDKKTRDEQQLVPKVGGDFMAWVPTYLEKHYTNPHSLKRYQAAWIPISTWMRENKLKHPHHIRYQHAQQYMDWRKSEDGGAAKHNTARLELKFFGSVMAEARRREITDRDPFKDAKIAKQAAAQKRELSDAEIEKINAVMKTKPAWMGVVFQIQINLGCRFNEARIPKSRFNFKGQPWVIIEDSKRKPTDKRKLFKVPIHEDFVPYLKKIKWVDGYTVPPLTFSNQSYNKVLMDTCGVTSHSCRVSFITRCHRHGVSQQHAMALVNHSDGLVHQIYTKLNVNDTALELKKIKPPPPAH